MQNAKQRRRKERRQKRLDISGELYAIMRKVEEGWQQKNDTKKPLFHIKRPGQSRIIVTRSFKKEGEETPLSLGYRFAGGYLFDPEGEYGNTLTKYGIRTPKEFVSMFL